MKFINDVTHTFTRGVEVWRDVPRYEGSYQVSDHGRVRSIDRYITECGGRIRLTRGRVLRPAASSSGHLSVVLGRQGGTKAIHPLVMLAFAGEPPPNHEVLHLNHTPSDNEYCNLKYGTRSENIAMDYADGRRSVAKKVVAIHTDATRHVFLSVSSAARAYFVSQPTVSHSLINKTCLRKSKVRFEYVE